MLVYGDLSRRVDLAQELQELADATLQLSACPPSLHRHAQLVARLIQVGEILQAVADADFRTQQQDWVGPDQALLLHLACDLARSVWISWQRGFAPTDLAGVALRVAQLRHLTGDMRVRVAEGFAFYGVYPEAFAAAAQVAGLSDVSCVIGLRSIGTVLAPMVAAGASSRHVVTVRPSGPVFERQLRLAPSLKADLVERPMDIAIVDEGPGLSGSSFGSALDLLHEAGIDSNRIMLFPSHGGEPGAQASPALRERFGAARRCVTTFDDLVLRAEDPAHRLDRWLEPHIGPLTAPLVDISGGQWRRWRIGDVAAWPAVHPFQERRKFLAETQGGIYVVKFVGLGQEGLRKVQLGQRLAGAGFCPQPLALCHGFSVEPWLAEASCLQPRHVPPRALATQVGRYLGWRAAHCPAGADAERGASVAALHAMADQNMREAGLHDEAAALQVWRSQLADLQAEVQRVETDNRLHAWEWLVRADGHLIKTDACDHHAAHDLIGCQDMAWDLAGAMIELDLDASTCRQLVDVAAGHANRRPSPALLALMQICYCAFQLGAQTMARDAHADRTEAQRADAQVQRYKAHLQRMTRHDMSTRSSTSLQATGA